MIRLEVFGEEKKEEKVVRLRLVQDGGLVKLLAVDEKGARFTDGCILSITPNGRVKFYGYTNPGLGLDLDGEGRIKVVE